MATTNVLTTVSGTGYTLNTTACNLSTDLTDKDFVVLHNGVLTPLSNYTKTTTTTLKYTGPSLASTTVEVRRSTPTSTALPSARFGGRIRSDDWNKELERVVRRAEEYALNGVGPGSIVSVQTPQSDPFGLLWSTDTQYPPSRKAVYDWGVNLVSATTLTSSLVPYVKTADLSSLLTAYAPLASPSFTGNPTASTQVTSDSSQRLATTAYVKNQGYATESFVTGQGYATQGYVTGQGYATQSYVTGQGYATQGYVNGQGFATQSYVTGQNYATQGYVTGQGYITSGNANLLARPYLMAVQTTSQTLLSQNTTRIICGTKYSDINNVLNGTTGVITIPTTAVYEIQCGVAISSGSCAMQIYLNINGNAVRTLDHRDSALFFGNTIPQYLVAGDQVAFDVFMVSAGNSSRATNTANTFVSIRRLLV